jgi:hypothetical protein
VTEMISSRPATSGYVAFVDWDNFNQHRILPVWWPGASARRRTFRRGRYASEEQGDAEKTQRRWSEHIAGRAVSGGDCAQWRLAGDGEEDHGAGNRGPSESIPSAARRGSTSRGRVAEKLDLWMGN